jgi:alginate O-acetyltransferase complex protein AlgI
VSLAGLEFAMFFPLVLLVHWLGPRRAAWQNAVLLLASVVFYATWDKGLLAVLAGAVALSFGSGLAIGAVHGRARTWVTGLAVAAQLGILGVFKYAGFFAQSLNALAATAGLPDLMPVLRIALPLGISYTTLIQVGYLLEVHWERAPACRDPLAYGTFVAFFPQLIAGPIGRARVLLTQYRVPRSLTAAGVATGAGEFLLGFTLKAFVADWLAPRVVDPVFADPSSFGAVAAWAALLGYATQLFCDFGGYSLMALGTGRFFGLELPVNFRHPYLSVSLAEFWRRWHISLNTWLFDYLFAPLTTGRSWFRGRTGPGFLVVFLVSGLWHGPTWTYVLWGGMHGLALWGHHLYDERYKGLCRKDRAWVARRKARPYLLASWALTQFFFLLTLVPFRAPTIEGAWAFAQALVGAGGAAGVPERFGVQFAACVAFFAGYHLLEVGPGPRLKGRFESLPAPVRGVAYGLLLAFLFVYVPVGASTFIYAQF